MSDNVVRLSSYKKVTQVEAGAKPVRLAGAALLGKKREEQVKVLIEKSKANGGYIVGAFGERFMLDESSIFGFKAPDSWRDLAALRKGSESWLTAHNRKANFVVTAHYPLLGATVYFNYFKVESMYKCEVYIYQHNEVVPTFSASSWFEDINDAVTLLNTISDKVLEKVLRELKKKYNMSLIDFESTKNIHSRNYYQSNGSGSSKKG